MSDCVPMVTVKRLLKVIILLIAAGSHSVGIFTPDWFTQHLHLFYSKLFFVCVCVCVCVCM